MTEIARRFTISIGSFVLAWLVVSLVARWLFGSGNVLVWVIAAAVGVAAYLAIPRLGHRGLTPFQ